MPPAHLDVQPGSVLPASAGSAWAAAVAAVTAEAAAGWLALWAGAGAVIGPRPESAVSGTSQRGDHGGAAVAQS
jgi:hypothetical protein